MAQKRRRCARCKRFMKKGTHGLLCPRCKGTKKKIKKKNGQRLSNRAIENLKYCFCYLSSHPCVDCGESDIVVLQFDHVRGKKRDNVSSLARKGLSLSIVQKEIAKCEVRCANCHVRKTAKEQNWYKTR